MAYEYTDIYLEQGITSLREAGWAEGHLNLVRLVFKEKMHWAEDAGREDGKHQGIAAAEDSLITSLNQLRETI